MMYKHKMPGQVGTPSGFPRIQYTETHRVLCGQTLARLQRSLATGWRTVENEIKKQTITSLCEITVIFNIMKLLQIYFLFQPVLHGWCNKGYGMCYPVCGMMHIKEPLLLIGKNSLCGSSGFPLSLSVCSFTICLTPYNRK